MPSFSILDCVHENWEVQIDSSWMRLQQLTSGTDVDALPVADVVPADVVKKPSG
jgi:hypothetical protein